MKTLKTLSLIPFFLLILQFSRAQNPRKWTFTQPKMGSPFSIIVYSNDSLKVSSATARAYKLVDSLNQVYSDYDAQSELSILSRKGQSAGVSDALWDILKQSQVAYQKSSGAFDITIGPLVKLWRKARKEKQLPADSVLRKAQVSVGFQWVQMNEKTHAVKLNKSAMQLDLGGIAKGYIAQKVVDFLAKEGLGASLVDAGGDLAMGQAPPSKKAWSVGVNIPSSEELLPRYLLLQNAAVATSGDMYQFVEIDGKHYSHIVNPKTGLGLSHQRNVTVIAPDGATADWLATACSVLPVKKALKLCDSFPNTGLLIAEKKGTMLFRWQNSYFEKMME